MRPPDGTTTRGHAFPKHVWIDVTGSSTSRSPGLLLEWRRTPSGWEALCVYASGGGNRRWSLTEAWVRAEHVSPAT